MLLPATLDSPVAQTGLSRELGGQEIFFVVLVVGVVLAGAAKLILGPRSSLSWPASILAGIVGAAIGTPFAELISHGTGWGILIFSMIFTILTLLIAERWKRRDEPVAELIDSGENAKVEFKSTARANLANGGVKDERLEVVIAKTVAGFLNSHGGNLIIGVDDSGTAIGLAPDLALMKSPDHDRYELWLRDMLVATLGTTAVSSIRVEFPKVGDQDVCLLRVPASGRPVFLRAKGKPPVFYARVGNSTREFPVDEALAYVSRHWRIGLASRLGRARG